VSCSIPFRYQSEGPLFFFFIDSIPALLGASSFSHKRSSALRISASLLMSLFFFPRYKSALPPFRISPANQGRALPLSLAGQRFLLFVRSFFPLSPIFSYLFPSLRCCVFYLSLFSASPFLFTRKIFFSRVAQFSAPSFFCFGETFSP